MMEIGTLVFFCGKMGAGKSTKAEEIAKTNKAVLLSEDKWLASLYPNKIHSFDDYIVYSNLLKPQIKQLTQTILQAGANVVLDFPANTAKQRAWFKDIYLSINASHELIYVDVPNELCLKRIAQRSIEQPERASTDTKEMFEAVTQHFSAPEHHELFNVVHVKTQD